MKKLALFLLILCSFSAGFAMEITSNEIMEHDTCCHWCRYSKNRARSKTREFNDCMRCKKTYCQYCIEYDPSIALTKIGCLHCRQECCCMIEICTRDHECCYTFRRHQARLRKNPEIKARKIRKKVPAQEQNVINDDVYTADIVLNNPDGTNDDIYIADIAAEDPNIIDVGYILAADAALNDPAFSALYKKSLYDIKNNSHDKI